MEDVQQHGGIRVAGFDGDESGLAQQVQGLGTAPDLQLWQDTRLPSQFEHSAVSLGSTAEVQGGLMCARRRGRDATSAELGHQIHFPLELLEPRGALLVVIDDPRRKADRAFHRQAQVGDSLPEIRQRLALIDVLLHGTDPRLDALVTGLRGDLHFLGQRQLMAHQRAGIQAVAERMEVRRANPSLARVARRGPFTGGRCQERAGGQHFSPRYKWLHRVSPVSFPVLRNRRPVCKGPAADCPDFRDDEKAASPRIPKRCPGVPAGPKRC